MHLFLQICGVVGFGFLGLAYIEISLIKNDVLCNLSAANLGRLGFYSFALISTYFIFG